MQLDLNLKGRLLDACRELVEQKSTLIQQELDAARNSGNEETKSSAGDKHETGRAMAQLAQENLSKQLQQVALLSKSLDELEPITELKSAKAGALIQTSSMCLFLGISLGKITVGDLMVYCISLASPVGQSILNKQKGDTYTLNGQSQTILDII